MMRRNINSFGGSVNVHLTNIVGSGATQVIQSLLPEFEKNSHFEVKKIYLPDKGDLAFYHCSQASTLVEIYKRYLPNSLSRVLECTIFANRFSTNSSLLVLGDLPLRCCSFQTVMLHQSNLLTSLWDNITRKRLKYLFGRALLRFNLSRVQAFIVQTGLMRDKLEHIYPSMVGKIYVVSMPPPAWLIKSGLKRQGRVQPLASSLTLIYPSSFYPHKNHALLSLIDPCDLWPVDELRLTLVEEANPGNHIPWLKCVGFLSPDAVIWNYSQVDALLFLSKEESYGLPLVEAMFVGLPVVCPNLPYARTLCGDHAIYFDPDSPSSLRDALSELKNKLDDGWWPRWTEQIKDIPRDWETVAERILAIATNFSTGPRGAIVGKNCLGGQADNPTDS